MRERQERRPFDPSEVELPPGLEESGDGDPLKRALALFSRIGQAEPEEAEPEGDVTEPGAADVAEAEGNGHRPDGSPGREGASAGGAGNGVSATGANGRSRPGSEEARRPRAGRPIYTLQDVHERTGIPYATLALYAVSHRERIPFLGERHSPAYPREGLEEFCRIHEEKNPAWKRPEEGTESGWDDEAGLSHRLEALEEDQDRLAAELRSIVAEVRRTWKGEAEWV